MNKRRIKDEVSFVAEHLEELKCRQAAERKAYFENPENAELIAETHQSLAIAEQLYKARKKARIPKEKFYNKKRGVR